MPDQVERWLAPALRKSGIELHTVRLDLAQIEPADDQDMDTAMLAFLSQLPSFDCLIVAPAVSESSVSLSNPAGVNEVLTASFAFIKATVMHFEKQAIGGRIVSLLGGEAAMGDPAAPADSAVAGAMLSLFRTVSLELRKTAITANTIVYAAADDPASLPCEASAASVAAMIGTLCGADAQAINGQEIYSLGGADSGRLHP
jgi:NAD(P)-dependent dehydrogenase (short-subunit alcohol dehydrogenase family)